MAITPPAPPAVLATYTTLSIALERVLELTQYDGDRETELTDLLTLSAGIIRLEGTAVIHYRPWFCAAKTKEQEIDVQALVKAEDGITFTGMVVPIKSWLFNQQAYDDSYKLELTSPYWSAAHLLQEMYGISTGPVMSAFSI